MKLLNRAVLLMGLTAICLTAGLTSCSNDDDGTDKGTNDDTDLVSKAIEGTDYTLSTTGDKSSDWTIKSDIGLVAFSEWVNEDAAHTLTNATLAADLDLSRLCGADLGVSWTPIGKDETMPYSGTFDGAGHTVSNLYVKDATFAGLFGVVKGEGSIWNLGIENCNVEGTSCIGGLVGANYGSLIACHVTGIVAGAATATKDTNAGGLAGSNNSGGVLTACYATPTVTGSYAGGLAGSNSGTLQYCLGITDTDTDIIGKEEGGSNISSGIILASGLNAPGDETSWGFSHLNKGITLWNFEPAHVDKQCLYHWIAGTATPQLAPGTPVSSGNGSSVPSLPGEEL